MKGIETKKQLWTVGAVLIVGMGLGLARLEAQTAISADGMVESTSGGFKFPDGSVQGSAAVAGSAPVEDKGLDATQCFDEEGNSRSCTGTGEDGEHQAGVAWPTPRFTDNGDGTVTDNLTGLIWLKEANCPAGTKTWQEALDWVVLLNFTSIACTDYAAQTHSDWRLPNIKELLSLVDYGESAPALPMGHPFMDVQSSFYWSSSSDVSGPASAWGANMNHGDFVDDSKTSNGFVWPVRGGQ